MGMLVACLGFVVGCVLGGWSERLMWFRRHHFSHKVSACNERLGSAGLAAEHTKPAASCGGYTERAKHPARPPMTPLRTHGALKAVRGNPQRCSPHCPCSPLLQVCVVYSSSSEGSSSEKSDSEAGGEGSRRGEAAAAR